MKKSPKSNIVSLFSLILFIIVMIYGFNIIKNIKENPCYYSGIQSHHPDNCYINTAIEKNDPIFCDKLEGVYGLLNDDNLMGTCYTELAVLNKDPSFCKKPTGKYLSVVQEDCFSEVAVSTNDLNVCEISTNRLGCIFAMSNHRNDLELCYQLKGENARYYCFDARTRDSGNDPTFCNKIIPIDGKEICINTTAYYHKDVSLCETIQKTSIRDNCFYTVAWSSKNSSVCEKISHSEWNSSELRDQCYVYSK